MIAAGSNVKIIHQSENFQVSFVGKALQSGAIGDTINVKNIKSRKVISGIIDENSNVRIQ